MTSSSVPPATSSSRGEPPEAAVVAFGALLLAARDPIDAADAVVTYVRTPHGGSRGMLERAGISAKRVDEFRGLFPSDPSALAASASSGAYWALGHRARPERRDRWFPVMSGTDLDRDEFDRRTGETLIGLISRAREHLRLFSAYVDGAGLRALAPAVTGATARGVDVDLVTVRRLERDDAPDILRALVDADGDASRLRMHRLEGMAWFAHVKLLTVDSSSAYIGSANMTFAGMTTNFEVGALVEGAAVVAYENLVDELVRRVLEAPPVLDGEVPGE